MLATRADLAFALTNLSRFASEPHQIHMQALKRVLRYIKGTRDFKLIYPKGSADSLCGESDASWSVTRDGKGFSAYLVRVAGAITAWKSLKQKMVALSSAESELLAALEGVRELIWFRGLLTELKVGLVNYPIILYVDSQALISMITSFGLTARTKHFARKLCFVREEIEKGNIVLKYKPSEFLSVDVLTKNVSNVVMQRHLANINLLLFSNNHK